MRRSLLLAFLFLPLPVMSAPKFVIQYRDQFGNYRTTKPSTVEPLPIEPLKPRHDRRARSIESLMGTGTWWISSIPEPLGSRQSNHLSWEVLL